MKIIYKDYYNPYHYSFSSHHYHFILTSNSTHFYLLHYDYLYQQHQRKKENSP